MQPFNRSKIMLVGRGHAGKTSTVNALLGRPFDPKQPSTIGSTTTETTTPRLDTIESAAWQVVEQGRELQRIVVAQMQGDKGTATTAAPFDRMAESVAQNATLAPRNLGSDVEPAPDTAVQVAPPAEGAQLAAMAAVAVTPAFEGPTLVERMTQLVEETTLLEGVLKDLDELDRGIAAHQAIRFSIWDLAGQTVFYDLLHILLTRYAVYVICFDMEDMIADDNGKVDCLEYIKFWLTSIHLHASGAQVCLVGTHKDKVTDRKQHEAIHREISTNLVGHPMLENHRVKVNGDDGLIFFPVDNTRAPSDLTVIHLRKALEETARGQDYVSFQIPASWLACLDAVRAMAKDQQLQRMTLVNMKQLAATFGIQENSFDLMMKVSHSVCVYSFMSYGCVLLARDTSQANRSSTSLAFGCTLRILRCVTRWYWIRNGSSIALHVSFVTSVSTNPVTISCCSMSASLRISLSWPGCIHHSFRCYGASTARVNVACCCS
jgi:GTPase SAR1 family protein